VTQELGIIALIKRGVRVLTANGDDLTDSKDPSRKMMRQIAGSFAEYEKARLVAKLKAARDRKREETGKCGGRKSYAEAKPETVALAKPPEATPRQPARRTPPAPCNPCLAEIRRAAQLGRHAKLLTHGGKPWQTPVGDPNFVCVRILVTRSRPKFLKRHPGAFSKIGSL
jgi:phage gp16-like protein